LLTGTQERADSIFNMVKAHYLRLVDSVASANLSHPRVLMGAPWEDVWYISPSNSYSARLVEDAGGDYLFNDLIAPNSRPFATETVFSRATKADIWLNPGAAYTLGEIKGQDYRMAQLPAFVNKKVYNHNRRAVKGAGNDYWESAVVRPDVVLRDIVSILHPGFIPGYTPVYYKEIE